jgi:chromosome segregation ATPase
LATIRAAAQVSRSMNMPRRPEFDFIELALSGKQMGFEKVIKMIDAMTKNLAKEQKDDNSKKEYCEKSIDETEDKKKVLENNLEDSNTNIEDTDGAIANLKSELAALADGINKLDKSVAEATATRKQEHADCEDLIASDTAAKEILGFAKNRLNKFYNPKLYKPPAKKELSAEDRIVENMGSAAAFVQVSAHSQDDKVAPPPPPEAVGAYTKKSEESTGVIAMIDLLVADLDKEMQIAKIDEKNAQDEYETLMADSGAKRAADSKSITNKESAKAENEESLQAEKENNAALTTEHMETAKELFGFHGECDWLLKFFDVRREARTGEIDALGKAKAVLNGADYSLLQTARRLRGSA